MDLHRILNHPPPPVASRAATPNREEPPAPPVPSGSGLGPVHPTDRAGLSAAADRGGRHRLTRSQSPQGPAAKRPRENTPDMEQEAAAALLAMAAASGPGPGGPPVRSSHARPSSGPAASASGASSRPGVPEDVRADVQQYVQQLKTLRDPRPLGTTRKKEVKASILSALHKLGQTGQSINLSSLRELASTEDWKRHIDHKHIGDVDRYLGYLAGDPKGRGVGAVNRMDRIRDQLSEEIQEDIDAFLNTPRSLHGRPPYELSRETKRIDKNFLMKTLADFQSNGLDISFDGLKNLASDRTWQAYVNPNKHYIVDLYLPNAGLWRAAPPVPANVGSAGASAGPSQQA